MKSRVLFLLALWASGMSVSAQNLVPNGSFEEGSECPMFLDDLHFRCNDWYKSIQVPGVPMNENPSPDWYHACSEQPLLSTPDFVFGHQTPYEGEGLAAIVCFDRSDEDYREIIGVELSQETVIDQLYFISFRLAAEGQKISTGFATDKIGFKMTTHPTFSSSEGAIDNEAHGSIDYIVTDTTNWELISFEFIADSNYSYLHVGSFFSDANIDTVTIGGDFPLMAYYLVDDVRLSTEPLSISRSDVSIGLKVYPNPVSDYLLISIDGYLKVQDYMSYRVYNTNGNLIISKHLFNSNKIKVAELKQGLYLLEIMHKGNLYTEKFLKM